MSSQQNCPDMLGHVQKTKIQFAPAIFLMLNIYVNLFYFLAHIKGHVKHGPYGPAGASPHAPQGHTHLGPHAPQGHQRKHG